MLLDRKILIVGINPSSAKADKLCQSINCIGRPGPYTHRDVEYEFLQECSEGYDKVLALGGFPSKALNKIGVEHFTLPHPSGLNRKLNDKEYERQILEKCSEYLKA